MQDGRVLTVIRDADSGTDFGGNLVILDVAQLGRVSAEHAGGGRTGNDARNQSLPAADPGDHQ